MYNDKRYGATKHSYPADQSLNALSLPSPTARPAAAGLTIECRHYVEVTYCVTSKSIWLKVRVPYIRAARRLELQAFAEYMRSPPLKSKPRT